MRITLATTVNNPDLEPADPLNFFFRPSFMAGYNMLDRTDFSGNGRDMLFDGAFDQEGAILVPDRANVMTMPVPEQENMTVFICNNLAGSANTDPQRSLLTNLNSASTPYKGMRIAQRSNSTQFDVQVAIDSAPNLEGIVITLAGAWTVRCFRWNSTVANSMTHGGQITTIPRTAPLHSANPTSPFYFSGVPEGITNPGVITQGVSGKAGMVLFYNELMSNSDATSIMDQISLNMAIRSVNVP